MSREREPLPQAYCRPDKITRQKIRSGSYYHCRHAPPSRPQFPLLKKTIRTAAQTFPFIIFFFTDCSLCLSPVAVMSSASCRRFKGGFLFAAQPQLPSFSSFVYQHGSSLTFRSDIEPYRDHHYPLIESHVVSAFTNVCILSITVFLSVWCKKVMIFKSRLLQCL